MEKKSTAEITKLNAKLNKQESLVVKYFGVENEMVSLRSAILTKDNEISTLRSQIENILNGGNPISSSTSKKLQSSISSDLLDQAA